MAKLFVRERRQAGEGTGQPRFRIVATAGTDVRVFVPHLRRVELDQLANEIGAEVVYLSRGEGAEEHQGRRGGRRHRVPMEDQD